MNCQQIQKLIHAHHDGELDAANTLQVDEHLADCPQCFATLRQLSTLRSTLRNEGLRYSAPSDLRQRLSASLAGAEAAERPAATVAARSWTRHLGWAVAAVAILCSGLLLMLNTTQDRDPLVAELTSSHIRSLMANHLMDVPSTDQHTVKPWFDGKLDFAPPVRDLRESGFPLVGGRLDYIGGRPAAALVYGRQKHFINLFVWPAPAGSPEKLQTTQRNGYNLARWSDGKMSYAAVSDLNETDLRVFVGDWTGR